MAPRVHSARIQQLLTSLQESIVDKPPYTSGTIRLPKSLFSLFYKDGEVARFGAPNFSEANNPSVTFFFADISTLPILLRMSWNNSLGPVNQLRLA